MVNQTGFKGVKDQVVGQAKQTFSNNPVTQVKGAVQEAKGKVESAYADAKDKANGEA